MSVRLASRALQLRVLQRLGRGHADDAVRAVRRAHGRRRRRHDVEVPGDGAVVRRRVPQRVGADGAEVQVLRRCVEADLVRARNREGHVSWAGGAELNARYRDV
jgi:hypothetical protein